MDFEFVLFLYRDFILKNINTGSKWPWPLNPLKWFDSTFYQIELWLNLFKSLITHNLVTTNKIVNYHMNWWHVIYIYIKIYILQIRYVRPCLHKKSFKWRGHIATRSYSFVSFSDNIDTNITLSLFLSFSLFGHSLVSIVIFPKRKLSVNNKKNRKEMY